MLITIKLMRVFKNTPLKTFGQGGARPVRRRWIRLWHLHGSMYRTVYIAREKWPFITPAPTPFPCTWECAHAYRVSMIFVSYMMNDKPTYYILSFSLLFPPSPGLSVEWLQAIHLLFEIKAFSFLCFPCHPMVVRTFYLKLSIISITCWERRSDHFWGSGPLQTHWVVNYLDWVPGGQSHVSCPCTSQNVHPRFESISSWVALHQVSASGKLQRQN